MADLKAFTTLLDSTLSAPRLSGTKVASLTSLSADLTAKNLDTDLITSFYRANNALPPAGQGRISSLYVFDAIARAARSGANKEKEKGKAREGRGMTGLITKMEGVADSWVGGMMDDASGAPWTEGRDKMRKILDIWVKGSTFPSPTLDRLKQKLNPSAPPSAPQSVKSPGYGGSAHAGPSTTPPDSPLKTAPLLGAHDGYANFGAMGASATDRVGQNGQATVPAPAASSSALPADILKLLGAVGASGSSPAPVPSAQSPTPASASTGAAAVDIASILAAVRPGGLAPPSSTGPNGGGPSAPSVPAPVGNSALGLASLGLRPEQLAALTALTNAQNGSNSPHQNAQNGHPAQLGQQPFSPTMFSSANAGPSGYPLKGQAPFNGGGGPPGPGGAGGAGGNQFPQPPGMHMGGPSTGSYDARGPPFPPYAPGQGQGGARGWDNQRGGPGMPGPGPQYQVPAQESNGHGTSNGGRFDGPGGTGGQDWERGRNGHGSGPPAGDYGRNGNGNGKGSGWNGDRNRSRSPPNRHGREGRDGRGGSRDFGVGAGARDGGWNADQHRRPDQDGGRWRNDRRGGPDDRARDQGYGNRPQQQQQQQQQQHGGPQSPQRNTNGRGGGGRAPLPEGRDMQLEGGEAANSGRPASQAGSVGHGTPVPVTRDGRTPAPIGLSRTPQQILAGLPSVPAPGSASGSENAHMPLSEKMSLNMGGGNGNGNGNGNNGSHNVSGERLETFNIATFNPMMPECWASLGRAFKNTTGREPGQMELMGFLAGQGPVPLPIAGAGLGAVMNGGSNDGAGTGQGQGHFGDPGMGMGNGMGMQNGQGWSNGHGHGVTFGGQGMGGMGNMGNMGFQGHFSGGTGQNNGQGQF